MPVCSIEGRVPVEGAPRLSVWFWPPPNSSVCGVAVAVISKMLMSDAPLAVLAVAPVPPQTAPAMLTAVPSVNVIGVVPWSQIGVPPWPAVF